MDRDLQTILSIENIEDRVIAVKPIYVDLVGDLVAGIVLGQIMYYYRPGRDGRTKLRVKKDGYLWLAKKRKDWWDEIRVKSGALDRALKKLESKGIIIKETYKFDGVPIVHVRLSDDFHKMWWNYVQKNTDKLEWDIDVLNKQDENTPDEKENGKSDVVKCPQCNSPGVDKMYDSKQRCPYHLVRDGWIYIMGDWVDANGQKKPVPNVSNPKMKASVNARWNGQDKDWFRKNWLRSLEIARAAPFPMKSGWFNFSFFVRNDENPHKPFDGIWDYKESKQLQAKLASMRAGNFTSWKPATASSESNGNYNAFGG